MIEDYVNIWFVLGEDTGETWRSLVERTTHQAGPSVTSHRQEAGGLDIVAGDVIANIGYGSSTDFFPIESPLLALGYDVRKLRRRDGTQRLNKLLSIVELVYEAVQPRYVFGMLEHQFEAMGIELPTPVSDARLARSLIDHPCWLMLFPPEMVVEYGREWLLNLPVARSNQLGDGGVLLLASEAVTDRLDSDDLKENQYHYDHEVKPELQRATERLEEEFSRRHASSNG